MPAERSGRYRGVSAEDRRAERRERLLEAGLELLGTAGWGAETVRGVCEQARLTPRFFYESFPDRDALAVAVFERVELRVTRRVLAALAAAPDDSRARARAGFETLVGMLEEGPRLGRVALVEALGSEGLARRRLAAIRSLARVIAAQAQATYGGPLDEELVDVTSLVLAGGLVELLIVWLAGDLGVSRDRLVEDCTELFAATGDSAAAIAAARRANVRSV